VLDRKGVLHMIYFKGNASAGDIEYVWRNPNGKDFSQPLRVNSERRSVLAVGTVRKAVSVLVDAGLAYTVPGRGTFVSPR